MSSNEVITILFLAGLVYVIILCIKGPDEPITTYKNTEDDSPQDEREEWWPPKQ